MFHGSSNPAVLIVDDEPSILALLRSVLNENGYFVLTASSGGEALSEARRYRNRIDLLVTDFRMPGINGLELYKAMVTERPETNVLFITGAAFEVPASWQPFPLLEKPFSATAFVNQVQQALGAASAAH